ncbi:MAG: tRNA (guanosine(37)-N1)-methyltransferase TrmD [Veillonella sp.]|nr:tRNA (guanosine(37)-N1)-methyltransferase TrmD [Veillonella sp.]
MRIDIVSLFPEFFDAFFSHSIIKRAIEAERLSMGVTNPRDFSHNKHGQVDDTPDINSTYSTDEMCDEMSLIGNPSESIRRRVIFMGPTGQPFTQEKARELATYDQLVLICGHYEGVDYRVEEHLVDETISIGDYVLTGGELPAMVVADAVSRMIPGVLGAASGAQEDSFYEPLLECPQYTKPPEFRGWVVPDVLRSGHHKNIATWRQKEALKRTRLLRPDLLERPLTKEEIKLLKEIIAEESERDIGEV